MVVRDGEGAERAFVNVCRHRGSVVVEEAGSRKTLQCAYHAWTYGLDGSLRSAPRGRRQLSDADDLGLPSRSDSVPGGRSGFVNLDGEAPPLEDILGEVPAMLADGGIDVDGLAFHHRVDWEVAANWKIVVENFLECYHCAVAHPGFSAWSRPRRASTGSSAGRLAPEPVPAAEGPERGDRCPRASSTSSGRTQGSTSSRAGRTSRSARSCRSPPTGLTGSSTTSSLRTRTAPGSPSSSSSTIRSGGRTPASWSRCSAAPGRAPSPTAGLYLRASSWSLRSGAVSEAVEGEASRRA